MWSILHNSFHSASTDPPFVRPPLVKSPSKRRCEGQLAHPVLSGQAHGGSCGGHSRNKRLFTSAVHLVEHMGGRGLNHHRQLPGPWVMATICGFLPAILRVISSASVTANQSERAKHDMLVRIF